MQKFNKKDMEQPIVSVLMTAYNNEKYIGKIIESSLAKNLVQGLGKFIRNV
jgi:hypothetical protein